MALGVIFIPMLLERGSEDSRLSVRMEIPPKPDTKVFDPADNPPELKPIKPPKPIDKAIEEVKPEAKKQEVRIKPKQPANTKKSPVKPVRQSSKPTKPGQWIVQVGSFSQQVNAEVLRDKLKNSGIDAYMESAKANTGQIYRVRIGPMNDREKAEKLVGKLSKQGDYRAIVLAND